MQSRSVHSPLEELWQPSTWPGVHRHLIASLPQLVLHAAHRSTVILHALTAHLHPGWDVLKLQVLEVLECFLSPMQVC